MSDTLECDESELKNTHFLEQPPNDELMMISSVETHAALVMVPLFSGSRRRKQQFSSYYRELYEGNSNSHDAGILPSTSNIFKVASSRRTAAAGTARLKRRK